MSGVVAALRRRLAPDDEQTEKRDGLFTFQDFVGWRYGAVPGFAGGTLEEGLRNAATWACINVLARSIARTPLDVLRVARDRVVPVTPVPQVIATPSGIVRASVWRRQEAVSLLSDGNAFGQIVSHTPGGWPTQIEMIDPGIVGDRRLNTRGVPAVSVSGGPEQELWPHGPIWHVPGQMVVAGSPFALSPLKYAARTIGTSLSVEDFSLRYFTDGAHPTHALSLENDPGEEGAKEIKAKLIESTRGNREPFVHGSGVKLEQIQSDPNNTQFIELMRFEVEQACRFWLVPPSMIYAAVSGQNVTYTNVTQADLHYLKHALDDYLVSNDEALSAILPEPQFVRGNRDAILRADPLARAQIHEIRLRTKTRSINEVRRIEDEAPFADKLYDEPGIPGGAEAPIIPVTGAAS